MNGICLEIDVKLNHQNMYPIVFNYLHICLHHLHLLLIHLHYCSTARWLVLDLGTSLNVVHHASTPLGLVSHPADREPEMIYL